MADLTLIDILSPTAGGGSVLAVLYLWNRVTMLTSKLEQVATETDKGDKKLDKIFSEIKKLSESMSTKYLTKEEGKELIATQVELQILQHDKE